LHTWHSSIYSQNIMKKRGAAMKGAATQITIMS
jgi:hypothetical protein